MLWDGCELFVFVLAGELHRLEGGELWHLDRPRCFIRTILSPHFLRGARQLGVLRLREGLFRLCVRPPPRRRGGSFTPHALGMLNLPSRFGKE
jgi:hypothetical protein